MLSQASPSTALTVRPNPIGAVKRDSALDTTFSGPKAFEVSPEITHVHVARTSLRAEKDSNSTHDKGVVEWVTDRWRSLSFSDKLMTGLWAGLGALSLAVGSPLAVMDFGLAAMHFFWGPYSRGR